MPIDTYVQVFDSAPGRAGAAPSAAQTSQRFCDVIGVDFVLKLEYQQVEKDGVIVLVGACGYAR